MPKTIQVRNVPDSLHVCDEGPILNHRPFALQLMGCPASGGNPSAVLRQALIARREETLTYPRVFFFEVRGCNWSTIRLKVAWSAALRMLRQAPNILLAASAPLSLAFIPAGVIVSR
jgi:hypothetical protein